MKIALIRRSFRFDGGAERALSNFINLYRNWGVDLTLICESWSGRLPSSVKIESLTLKGNRASRQNSFRNQVQKILSTQYFDYVQSHEWIPSADILRLGDGLHSKWLELFGDKKGRIWRCYSGFSRFHQQRVIDERQSLQHPNLKTILVNSEFVRAQIQDKYPEVLDKTVLVRNVVPEAFFDQQGAVDPCFTAMGVANKRLLFVGSGWERKGLTDALHIMSRLGPEYTLTVVGHDKRAHFYRGLARSLGIGGQVLFVGPKPMSLNTYQLFDGLILPTLYDPFPNVICEALVSGLPVYCSGMCGATDFENMSGVHICYSMTDYEPVIRLSAEVPRSDYFRNQFSELNASKCMENIFW